MAIENSARLAVLIDADNARPSITEGLRAEVARAPRIAWPQTRR